MTIPGESDAAAAMFDYDSDDRDPDGILDPEAAFGEGAEDEVGAGWVPPDEPSGLDEYGTTLAEQRDGEGIAGRELRTLPEDWADDDLELADRLVDTDDGDAADTEADLVARQVSQRREDVDLTSEEAAVHLLDPSLELDVDRGTVALDEGSTND